MKTGNSSNAQRTAPKRTKTLSIRQVFVNSFCAAFSSRADPSLRLRQSRCPSQSRRR